MKPEGLGPTGPVDKGNEVAKPDSFGISDGVSNPIEPPAASRPGPSVDNGAGNRFVPHVSLGEGEVARNVPEPVPSEELPTVSVIPDGDVPVAEVVLPPSEQQSGDLVREETVREPAPRDPEAVLHSSISDELEPDMDNDKGELVGGDNSRKGDEIVLISNPPSDSTDNDDGVDPLTFELGLEKNMNDDMAKSVVHTARSEEITDQAIALTDQVPVNHRYTTLVNIGDTRRASGFEPTEELTEKARQAANPDKLAERHLLEEDKITELMYVGRLGNDREILNQARERINTGKFDDEPEPQLLKQNLLRRRLAIHHADLGDYDTALDIVDQMEPADPDLSHRTKTKIFSEQVELMKYTLDKEQNARLDQGASMPSSAERIYRAITQFPPDTYLDGTQNQRDAVLAGVADCCVKTGDYIAAEHCIGKISDTTLKIKGYLALARDYGKFDDTVAITGLQSEIATVYNGNGVPPAIQELVQTAIAQGHMDAGQVDDAIFPIITEQVKEPQNITAVAESFFKNPKWVANEGNEKVFDQVKSLPKQYQIDVLSLATSSLGNQDGEIADSQKAKLKDRLEKFAQAVRDDDFIEDRDRAELLAKAMETHVTLTNGKSDTLYAAFASDTEGIPLMEPVSRAIIKSHFKMGQYDKAFEFIDQVRPLALYTDVIPLLPNDPEVHKKLQDKIMSGALTEGYRINLLMSLAGRQVASGMDSTVNLEDLQAMIEGTRGSPESKIDLLLTLARLYRSDGMKPDQIAQLDDATSTSLKNTGIVGIDEALERYKSAA